MALENLSAGYEIDLMINLGTAFVVGVPRISHISKMIKKGQET